ncbi:hypothetical protein RRG08_023902 [Elysia crispata]|uniref:acireductone dioxygenase (Fe(2+)-requiring) n=1 Tax=Elysia crispata TaxID=231223 RepID=A0AAE1ADK0_9GAST|nr:hypothetical protein RRG08_023902 [Elysia crispata]
MVVAWLLKDPVENLNLPNTTEPTKYVCPSDLQNCLGVEIKKFNVQNMECNPEYVCMKRTKDYKEEETSMVKGSAEESDKKIDEESREHLDVDDEVWMVLEGSGYLDIRDRCDKWIRIEIKPGDMITIPGGMYHRLVLDEKNMIKTKRLFPGSSESAALIFRPDGDNHTARRAYLARMACYN